MNRPNWKKTFATLLCATLVAGSSLAATELKLGVVDFKQCVEKSRLGKQEQANFDAMKAQMESALSEKEKVLSDLSQKLQDADYLDSISADTETELKRKFRTLSQEMTQLQQQYYQVLQQAHYKVIQQINEAIAAAAKAVASANKFDLILNDETAFFAGDTLNVTDKVVDQMDKTFAEQPKDNNALKGAFPSK